MTPPVYLNVPVAQPLPSTTLRPVLALPVPVPVYVVYPLGCGVIGTSFLGALIFSLMCLVSSCSVDADCLDTFAECNTGTLTCLCKMGYTNVNGACKADLESTCGVGADCHDTFAECNTGTQTCLCKMGYTNVNGACKAVVFYSLADGMVLQKSVTLHCNSDDGSTDSVRSSLRARDNASDKQTISLQKGKELNIGFNLQKYAIVHVKDVIYSNDGGQDRIKLTLDDDELGEFWTQSTYCSGNGWNIFWSSGPVGEMVPVNAGQHTLSLKVDEADEYGIEIDYIRLELYGSTAQELQQEHFICKHHQ